MCPVHAHWHNFWCKENKCNSYSKNIRCGQLSNQHQTMWMPELEQNAKMQCNNGCGYMLAGGSLINQHWLLKHLLKYASSCRWQHCQASWPDSWGSKNQVSRLQCPYSRNLPPTHNTALTCLYSCILVYTLLGMAGTAKSKT